MNKTIAAAATSGTTKRVGLRPRPVVPPWTLGNWLRELRADDKGTSRAPADLIPGTVRGGRRGHPVGGQGGLEGS